MRESSSSRCARERRRLAASAALTWPLRFMSALSLDSSATARLRVSRSTFSLPISDLRPAPRTSDTAAVKHALRRNWCVVEIVIHCMTAAL